MSEWIDVPAAEVQIGDEVKVESMEGNAMTTETPCLGGCYKVPIVDAAGDDCMPDYRLARTVHVPNCPNAKPAEPPACECGAAVGHVCHAAECVPVCAYHSPTCPARKTAEPQGSEPIPWKVGDRHYWVPAYSHPDAAEMCGECGADWTPNNEPCPGPKQEPQGSEGSEPPIDFEQAANLAKTYSHETWSWVGNMARAHLALKAERDALKAEAMNLRHEWAQGYEEWSELKIENAALKARVEELENLVLVGKPSEIEQESREIIEARKEQEASNGK